MEREVLLIMHANGSGRTYTITYEATNAHGNSAQASATVTVKHNR